MAKQTERYAFNACDHVVEWYQMRHQRDGSSYHRYDAETYGEMSGRPYFVRGDFDAPLPDFLRAAA